MILSWVIAGKAILSLALFVFVENIMVVGITASAALVIAVILLMRGNVLRSSSDEENDDAPLLHGDILSVFKAIAIPLAGCLVCQCSLGIGWAAMILEHYSVVLQT